MSKRGLVVFPILLSVTCICRGNLVAAGLQATLIRVACLIDKTVSMKSAGMPSALLADFEPMLERLERVGGELGVGLIDEDVNAPFLRVQIIAPPAVPSAPIRINALDYALKKKLYDERDLPAYRGAMAQWQADARHALAVFRRGLEERLARRGNARFSPVNLALRRAQLFLSEPTSVHLQLRRFCVIYSDGIDTTNEPRVTLERSVRVLVVGSPGYMDKFADLKPIGFESLRSAFSQIE